MRVKDYALVERFSTMTLPDSNVAAGGTASGNVSAVRAVAAGG